MEISRETAGVKFTRNPYLRGDARLELPLKECLRREFVQYRITSALEHLHFVHVASFWINFEQKRPLPFNPSILSFGGYSGYTNLMTPGGLPTNTSTSPAYKPHHGMSSAINETFRGVALITDD
jgi:hypothetical protein